MKHLMKLTSAPFRMIKDGTKTIELRLYDDKRKKIKTRDRIEFVNIENNDDILVAEVVELFVFDSFKTLYDELPLLECGYTEKDIGTASPNDMDIYYSKEKQQKYGVVGIKIELL